MSLSQTKFFFQEKSKIKQKKVYITAPIQALVKCSMSRCKAKFKELYKPKRFKLSKKNINEQTQKKKSINEKKINKKKKFKKEKIERRKYLQDLKQSFIDQKIYPMDANLKGIDPALNMYPICYDQERLNKEVQMQQ